MWKIVFTKQALKDLKNLKAAGLAPKARALGDVLKENPFQTPPSYEGLVGNLQEFYSRRINIQHRMVFQVYADATEENGIQYAGTVKIIRMWTHYDKMK